MLDYNLTKYRDFKGFLDEYLQGQISKDEILEILEILRDRYETQHTALFEHLEKDPDFHRENLSWINKLKRAADCFEDARDTIEDLILDDSDDLEEALETFKEGNRLLNEVSLDLEEALERHTVLGDM